MLRKTLLAIATLATLPALARRRAVVAPEPLTHAAIVSTAIRVADRVTIDPDQPRLHWENAPYLDGLVLLGDELQHESNPDGTRLIERAASVILGSDDVINDIFWGDGTAWAQVALDLYRVLPANDPRRAALLATLSGPMSFAEHAIRVSPAAGSPRDPWWIDGGFGTRYWQDDMYMVIPWLAMNGSSRDGFRQASCRATSRTSGSRRMSTITVRHRPTRARLPFRPPARATAFSFGIRITISFSISRSGSAGATFSGAAATAGRRSR